MPARTPNNDRNNPRWNAGLPRSPPTAVNPKRLAQSITYSNDASGRAVGTNIKQSTMVVFIGIILAIIVLIRRVRSASAGIKDGGFTRV
ncbi:hypothetical protein FOZ63_007158 [Perkinsus olseni]|nr:hypothetical protein FOZ62_004983 [Perkinsus olseni]KAF4744222.1 hypothetical protein FOZ63_007158 [Perkinsus olseni]